MRRQLALQVLERPYAKKLCMSICLLKVTKKSKSEEIGSFESIKAVFRIHAPLSGKVTKTNNDLYQQPDLINEAPYGKGWLFVMAATDPKGELKKLMDAKKATAYYKVIIDEERAKFGEYDEP